MNLTFYFGKFFIILPLAKKDGFYMCGLKKISVVYVEEDWVSR